MFGEPFPEVVRLERMMNAEPKWRGCSAAEAAGESTGAKTSDDMSRESETLNVAKR